MSNYVRWWAVRALAALACGVMAYSHAETPVPAAHGFVVDTTGTLSPVERDDLIEQARFTERVTGAQLFTLIVERTDPEPIEAFAQRVFITWKPGRKGADDGLLLVLALKNDTRKTRLHVGYGLEGAIPDVAARRLLADKVRPLLDSRGAYLAATAAAEGVRELLPEQRSASGKSARVGATADVSSSTDRDHLQRRTFLLLGSAFLQLVPLLFALLLLQRPRSRAHRDRAGAIPRRRPRCPARDRRHAEARAALR